MKNLAFSIPQSGEMPYEFVGRVLTEARSFDLSQLDRGYALTVYIDREDQLYAHLVYHTRWKYETETDTVFVADDVEQLADKLLKYDPLTHVVGYPPGERFVEKQKRLLAWLTLEYKALVGRVLAVVAGKTATEDEQG